jgi:hypothetical protein
MGKFRDRNAFVKIIVVLIALINIIGFSILPATARFFSIHFPIVNKQMPIGADLISGLLISEILFNPGGSEPGGEWVEIFDRSSKPIQLTGYKIGDCEL